MRILHVISTLQMGGAEHLMVDLLPALRDLGNEVELLLIDGTKTAFYEELESLGIKISYLKCGGRIYSHTNIFRMAKAIQGYDIVHTHTFPCQLFAALSHNKKSKLITTEHSTTNHRRNKWWLKFLDRWMYKRFERIICISDKSKENLVNHLDKERGVVVINNGVNIKKFERTIKRRLSSPVIITMVASMRDAKDQDTVIKAMQYLGSNYRLHLVGDGPRREYLENLSKELDCTNNVVFFGNQSDIPSILESSDIVVLSSHWEGLSLSSIEGMASGRPFIASDVPGLGELVRNHGIVFPEGDYNQLAKCIEKLCRDNNYYYDIAKRCQESVLKYDVTIMAQKYYQLYKEILQYD